MVDFPSDDQVRLHRIAKQNATSDIAFLKLKSPEMSPEEESDTWRSLYTFHLKKLRGEI
jgi:hypothetical protein